jgi:hypothetical protein
MRAPHDLADEAAAFAVEHVVVQVLAAQRHDPRRAQAEQVHAGAQRVVRVHDVGLEAADGAFERLLEATFDVVPPNSSQRWPRVCSPSR